MGRLYVIAEYFKLHSQYASLKYRSYQLKKTIVASKPAVSASEAEGYELPAGEADEKQAAAAAAATPAAGGLSPELIKKKEALQAEWAVWKTQALINTYVMFNESALATIAFADTKRRELTDQGLHAAHDPLGHPRRALDKSAHHCYHWDGARLWQAAASVA